MATHSFTTKKLADLDVLVPGLQKVWKQIKAETGTKKRCPSSVTFTDQARPMMPNDSSCCRRFALDLQDMQLSAGVHVSAGEWAVSAQKNPDGPVQGVGNGQALISCEWNDFYGFFSIDIQVAEGSIPKQMA